MVGFDTAFGVAAVAVPAADIVQYQVDADSTNQVGCWPPCDCTLQPPQPLTGTFALVPIRPATTASGTSSDSVNEYAVVNVRWSVAAPTSVPVSYRGVGFYRRNLPGPWANPLPGQRMFLDLRTSNSTALIRFDSGVVPAPVEFPAIDIAMSIHGRMCFDTLIQLKATPATP